MLGSRKTGKDNNNTLEMTGDPPEKTGTEGVGWLYVETWGVFTASNREKTIVNVGRKC